MSTVYGYQKDKLNIGCSYVPFQAPLVHGDAALLQSALLDKRTATPLTGFRWLLGVIWSWA